MATNKVPWRDVVWKSDGDGRFSASVYEREGDTATERPVIVSLHGGAWCDNDRRVGKHYNMNLVAATGYVVIAIDFRKGDHFHHPAGSDDAAAAVEWVRAHHADLGIDRDRVALMGSSSGGHLSLLGALGLDEPVRGVIPMWPPTDPLARYRYAKAKGDDHGDRLARNTERYFETEHAMAQGAIWRVVADDEAVSLPPVFLVHPTADANVPREITEQLETTYRNAGGEIEVWWVPDQPHAFGHHDSPETDELIRRMASTLARWFE